MSQPGWYADPGGAPGQYRYWDGRAWAPTTSPTPGGTPEPSQGSSKVWIAIIGIVGVVVVAIIMVFAFNQGRVANPLAPDTNSASPSIPGWNEQQPTSQPPIEAPTGGTMVECPKTAVPSVNKYPNDGWLHGGGLKVKKISGWTDGRVAMGWVHDMSAQTENFNPMWFSMISVGALHVADGFQKPKVAAFQVMSCFATSQYYQNYTGRHDILSEPVNYNGHQGWRLRTEVYVDMKAYPEIAGDIVDVIVVDVGNPESFGVFISSVTIDDHRRITLVDAAIASLTTR